MDRDVVTHDAVVNEFARILRTDPTPADGNDR